MLNWEPDYQDFFEILYEEQGKNHGNVIKKEEMCRSYIVRSDLKIRDVRDSLSTRML